MAEMVQDSPFYAPGIITYLDAAGVAVPDKNVVASNINIRWGALTQRVSFNSDGKPLTASLPTTGVSP